MIAAIQEAIAKAIACPTCNNEANLVEKIDNTVYIYKPNLSTCAQAKHNVIFSLWDKIEIGPKAFNQAKCCDLSSTVAHEANHLLGGDEQSSRDLEKDCFNCPP
jgi:hypothetical protein